MSMWKDLPKSQKDEYKELILGFSSLSELFSQKNDSENKPGNIIPIVNSKYQEKVFQKAFHASAEDIGNTSFDAAISTTISGYIKKYLVGIKTFNINSDAQKVAQFKANMTSWASITNTILNNSRSKDDVFLSKEEINTNNHELYYKLALLISTIRNERIESSKANLRGFSIDAQEENIESVYHVLMPSSFNNKPIISVGETSYDTIDLSNLTVLGCTSNKHPLNFEFTDGKHRYKFTAADAQLYMYFDNHSIIQESWNVDYIDDAYKAIMDITNRVDSEDEIIESYSWTIANTRGIVERYSGWNAFYGIGSKMSKTNRVNVINNIVNEFSDLIPTITLKQLKLDLLNFLTNDTISKAQKEELRISILEATKRIKNSNLYDKIESILFRPMNEMYIPIPNAKQFHSKHPNFFGPNIGTFENSDSNKLALDISKRQFNLVFEPSGNSINAFITQDSGKAIESYEKQSTLGEWILRDVFRLNKYQPLTSEKLEELGINGIRLYKTTKSNDIHLKFIWLDKDNPPTDYVSK